MNVVQELAHFLEALEYQVLAWDRKVVETLTGNTEVFKRFQQGCPNTKWRIYSEIKYQGLN